VNNHKFYIPARTHPGILCSQTNGETKLLLGKGMALVWKDRFSLTLHEEELKFNWRCFCTLYDGLRSNEFKNELNGEDRLIILKEFGIYLRTSFKYV
jgi:hypothetical protein